jgi:hypothetical protein
MVFYIVFLWPKFCVDCFLVPADSTFCDIMLLFFYNEVGKGKRWREW